VASVLPCYEALRGHLAAKTEEKTSKDEKPSNPRTKKPENTIKTSAESGLEKLNKYWELANKSPIYFAATILDPRCNYAFFRRCWGKRDDFWLDDAKESLEDFYDKYYRPVALEGSIWGDDTDPNSIESEFPYHGFDTNYNPTSTRVPPSITNEFRRYLNQQPIGPRQCPWGWWRGHMKEFPTLYRMAMDLLSIPATSASLERVFSRYIPLSLKLINSVAQTLTNRRNRLSAKSLEACEVISSWEQSGLVSIDWVVDLDGE
jgi:hypothetical protein